MHLHVSVGNMGGRIGNMYTNQTTHKQKARQPSTEAVLINQIKAIFYMIGSLRI
jgi:hypothetical protein